LSTNSEVLRIIITWLLKNENSEESGRLLYQEKCELASEEILNSNNKYLKCTYFSGY